MVNDSLDLEFVKAPFAYNERKKIHICMPIIQQATNELMTLLTYNKISTINAWFTVLKKDQEKRKTNQIRIFTKIKTWGSTNKKHLMTGRLNISQVNIQHPLQSAINLYTTLYEETKILEEYKKPSTKKVAEH